MEYYNLANNEKDKNVNNNEMRKLLIVCSLRI